MVLPLKTFALLATVVLPSLGIPCVENKHCGSGVVNWASGLAYKRFALPVLMLSPPGPLADRESMALH